MSLRRGSAKWMSMMSDMRNNPQKILAGFDEVKDYKGIHLLNLFDT